MESTGSSTDSPSLPPSSLILLPSNKMAHRVPKLYRTYLQYLQRRTNRTELKHRPDGVRHGCLNDLHILATNSAAHPATRSAAVGIAASGRALLSATVAGMKVAVGEIAFCEGGVGTEPAPLKAGSWVEIDGFGVAVWLAGLRTLRYASCQHSWDLFHVLLAAICLVGTHLSITCTTPLLVRISGITILAELTKSWPFSLRMVTFSPQDGQEGLLILRVGGLC